MNWRPIWLHQLILAAVSPALYVSVIGHPFQYDGVKEILRNPVIRDISRIGLIWEYNPSRFLVTLSFALNRHFGGDDPTGYHLANIVLHSANALLVYHLIGLLLCAQSGLPERRGAEGLAARASFAGALLFAVHPLQTEAVTYIWQRSASMGAMFYLFSLIAYLKASLAKRDSAPARPWKGWLAASVLSAIAGMLTKQFCFTLPFAAILLEYCAVSGSWSRLKQKASMIWPLLLALPIIPALTIFYSAGEIADIAARAAETPSPYRYFLTQLNVVTMYLRLFIYPSGQNLDHDVPISAGLIDSAPSLALLLAILAGGFLSWGRSRAVTFGILFFFLSMSVESSFFPLPDIAFEHRMYLPSAGLFIALAGLAVNAGRWAGYILALALAAAIPLSAATAVRNKVWASEESLWEDVAAKSPEKWRGYLKLGAAKKRLGKYSEAEKMYEKAEALNPGIPDVSHDLGMLKKIGGDPAGAEKRFLRALELDPNLLISAMELGKLYISQHRYEEAQSAFAKAARIAPGFVLAHYLRGQALEQLEKYEEAQSAYKAALAARPGNGLVMERLAALERAMAAKQGAGHDSGLAKSPPGLR